METPKELLLSTWKEQVPQALDVPRRLKLLYLIGGVVVVALFIALGYFFKDWTLYLAAPAAILALVAMIVQSKRVEKPRTITLTNQRIILDEQSYLFTDLSGFWLEVEGNTVVIALEYKKPSIVPITCFFENTNEAQARQALRQALPELEPRRSHFTDTLNRYFHF
jgi:hypothetical protein